MRASQVLISALMSLLRIIDSHNTMSIDTDRKVNVELICVVEEKYLSEGIMWDVTYPDGIKTIFRCDDEDFERNSICKYDTKADKYGSRYLNAHRGLQCTCLKTVNKNVILYFAIKLYFPSAAPTVHRCITKKSNIMLYEIVLVPETMVHVRYGLWITRDILCCVADFNGVVSSIRTTRNNAADERIKLCDRLKCSITTSILNPNEPSVSKYQCEITSTIWNRTVIRKHVVTMMGNSNTSLVHDDAVTFTRHGSCSVLVSAGVNEHVVEPSRCRYPSIVWDGYKQGDRNEYSIDNNGLYTIKMDNCTYSMDNRRVANTKLRVTSANARPGIYYSIFNDDDHWYVYEAFVIGTSFIRLQNTSAGYYVKCVSPKYNTGSQSYLTVMQSCDANMFTVDTGYIVVHDIPGETYTCIVGENVYDSGIAMMVHEKAVTGPIWIHNVTSYRTEGKLCTRELLPTSATYNLNYCTVQCMLIIYIVFKIV